LNASLILHGQFDGDKKFKEHLEDEEVADRNKKFFESVKFENQTIDSFQQTFKTNSIKPPLPQKVKHLPTAASQKFLFTGDQQLKSDDFFSYKGKVINFIKKSDKTN
jgi:hypothetical protein